MELSTHKSEVVEVNFYKHPNADTLSVTKVWGYTYVGKSESWDNVKKAIYICPDSLVDTRLPEFMDLSLDAKYNADSSKPGPYARIRAKKYVEF